MNNYNNRRTKSYNGEMMERGKKGEEVVLDWLRSIDYYKEVIDMREFRVSQRLDVDCGIETIDGSIVLAEIKTDYNLGKTANFLFEVFRINHFANPDKVFYLGWTFRSPAKYLLYYSPNEYRVYQFRFEYLRQTIGKYVSQHKPRFHIEPTDDQKTTFNLLIPQAEFYGHVKAWSTIKLKEANS